eukprot:scaffold3586_cov164-Amphora_coffeaeformis.AAC.23
MWGTDLTYLPETCTKLTKFCIRMAEVDENMFDRYEYAIRRNALSEPRVLQRLHVVGHKALS